MITIKNRVFANKLFIYRYCSWLWLLVYFYAVCVSVHVYNLANQTEQLSICLHTHTLSHACVCDLMDGSVWLVCVLHGCQRVCVVHEQLVSWLSVCQNVCRTADCHWDRFECAWFASSLLLLPIVRVNIWNPYLKQLTLMPCSHTTKLYW